MFGLDYELAEKKLENLSRRKQGPVWKQSFPAGSVPRAEWQAWQHEWPGISEEDSEILDENGNQLPSPWGKLVFGRMPMLASSQELMTKVVN